MEDQHGTLLTSDLAGFNFPRTYLSIVTLHFDLPCVMDLCLTQKHNRERSFLHSLFFTLRKPQDHVTLRMG